MAGGTGAAGESLLLFRTGLRHFGMAAEAGIGDMALAEDFAVMHDLEVAALGLLVFGVVAACGAALELRGGSGHLVMAYGALLLRIDGQRSCVVWIV